MCSRAPASWTEVRKRFLAREKEFTRLRDELSAERRALPWQRVQKEYMFEAPDGKQTLAELFAGRSQLIVQHFMLGDGWQQGCKSCSFWADNYDGTDMNLAGPRRDVPGGLFSAVRADRSSFTPEALAQGDVEYNCRRIPLSMAELPGISVFYRDAEGAVFHTYSCYSRGLDMLNGAYHYLDLTPKGRDEDGLRQGMEWVRPHDS